MKVNCVKCLSINHFLKINQYHYFMYNLVLQIHCYFYSMRVIYLCLMHKHTDFHKILYAEF